MSPQWLKICLLLPAILALGACAARPAVNSAGVIPAEDVNPSFIAPGGELRELALTRSAHTGWEDFRNDGPVFDPDVPIYAPWVFLEVRHREHLSTISGRPREFSSTTTRTIRRELSR